MFDNFVSSQIGLIHLLTASLALIFGSFVLADAKGTVFHRRVGYLYALSMLGLNVTAFMIYRLFGRFGVFHWTAVVSLVTLLAGMIPVILRRPAKHWLGLHFNFMYWSVFGLYAAFVAEMATRLPIRTAFSSATTFFMMVGAATFATMFIGRIILLKYKKRWQNFGVAPNAKEKPFAPLEEST
jgi:uncharacterized membrane protein